VDLQSALMLRQAIVERQARQVAEFQTVRPTPAPDEVIEGQIVMTKQWDLSKIQDDQSPDPTEPPGRPAPVPVCSSPGEVMGLRQSGPRRWSRPPEAGRTRRAATATR
jgi:hypothetical protein